MKIINNKQKKSMNKKLGLLIRPRFFYCYGECVRAEDYTDKKYFPLIHDSELGD